MPNFNYELIINADNFPVTRCYLFVYFCDHCHTFVKIDEFVMGHPCRNGTTACLRHPCTIENIARYNVGLLYGLA